MASRPPRPPRPPLHVKKEFRIKKETPDDEIKEYAETAMNEFLGWYGYDKVDSRDTQGLDLHHFSRRRPSGTDDDSSDDAQSCSSPKRDNPASPMSGGSTSAPNGCVTCCWCNKLALHKSFSLKTSAGLKYFCSELCFTQCRRANFKRNKTCDWCRHIRHTVNYVDFQDGEHQLQFCSDKCLNQYKMNIFCKETEAHLQLHPHMSDEGGSSSSGPGGLITPELWLRDCRSASPSASPSPPPEPPKDDKKRLRKMGKFGGKSQMVYPPPLLPMNMVNPNLPPPRPPYLSSYLSHIRGPRLPMQMISPPSPPPPTVMPPPPPRPSFPPPPPPPLLPVKSILPPVTILVPYPIPLPIPLPVPIPIPIPLDMTKLPFMMKKAQTEVNETKDEEPIVKIVEKVDDKKTKNNSATPPATSSSIPRPLRKRRRVTELSKDTETVSKQKTVPA